MDGIPEASSHDIFGNIAERALKSAELSTKVQTNESRLLVEDQRLLEESRKILAENRVKFLAGAVPVEEGLSHLKKSPDVESQKAYEAGMHGLKLMGDAFFQTSEVAIAALDKSVANAMESLFDSSTPLYARRAAVRICSEIIREQQAEPGAEQSPVQVYFEIGDGMLYHAANENLTTKGFDRRLVLEAQAQIEFAQLLGGEKTPYRLAEDQPEIDQFPTLSRYAPEGSVIRSKIDRINQIKKDDPNSSVEYFEIRVNSGGGDEFLRTYITKGNSAEELLQLSREVTIGITRSTTIIKDRELLPVGATVPELSDSEKQRRLGLRDHFSNSVNSLKIGETYDYNPHEVKLLNTFVDRYRSFIRDEQNLQIESLLLNPRADIAMDMALFTFPEGRLPTLDDAKTMFVAGIDSQGNRLMNATGEPDYGFYSEDGQPNEEKVNVYAKQVGERVRAQLGEKFRDDPELFHKTVVTMISEDTVDNFITTLNSWVNSEGKPAKKKQVMREAYAPEPNPQAVFTIGATVESGRSVFQALELDEKVQFVADICRKWEERFDQLEEEYQRQPSAQAKHDFYDANIALFKFSSSWNIAKRDYPAFDSTQIQKLNIDRRESSRE